MQSGLALGTHPPALVLAIDQGTTSVRASLLDANLSTLASHAESVPRSFPRPGWVELSADELVAATERAAKSVLESGAAAGKPIAAMGFANQGETVVVWERKTGLPIAPAIVWQCRRTEEACERLRRDEVISARVKQQTGLPIDPYFSATKIAWLLDQIPGARAKAERGELLAGTLDTFTLFRLSGGRCFVTDPSTACRTLLAPLKSGGFDDTLCEIFRVPKDMLAEVVPSNSSTGPVRIGGFETQVCAMLCDQPAALLGTGCIQRGQAKCTYGTGAFLQVNTGPDFGADGRDGLDANGLLRSIAWDIDNIRTYLIEGSVLAAGDVLTWLKDDIGLIHRIEEVEASLRNTIDSAGILFVPALGGLGAPRWAGGARGTLLGLHRGTKREHILRAALEGIAHQIADILDIAAPLVPEGERLLWADGGLSSSAAFIELQANISGWPLARAAQPEATTKGVAALAAFGAGMIPSLSGAIRQEPSLTAHPAWPEPARAAARKRWQDCINLIVSQTMLNIIQSNTSGT